MDKDNIISQLENKIIILQKQNTDLEERLKKYTDNTKKYYENHKEEIKQKIKEYKEKTNYKIPFEKKQEYNRLAYLKRKEKLNLD
jgi:hypothetical protein